MPPTADSPGQPIQPAESGVSGKLVIIGILTLALLAAGGSWWFRYNATRHAVRFWGPEAALLIRDAPSVTLYENPSQIAESEFRGLLQNPTDSEVKDAKATISTKLLASAVDVSHAHGLAHLRNALIEDHNFNWPADETNSAGADARPYWHLTFKDPATGKMTTIQFAKDCSQALRNAKDAPLWVELDAKTAGGLREVFAEFASPQSDSEAKSEKPSAESASPAAR